MIDVIIDKYPTSHVLNQKSAPFPPFFDNQTQYIQALRLQAQKMTSLARESAILLKRHQHPNGLIPATLGRYDDSDFENQCWSRDVFLATQPATDQTVKTYTPKTWEEIVPVYLSSAFSLIQILTQPEQIHHFLTTPGPPEYDGYHSVDCHQIPLVKCSVTGKRTDWGHDQPDALGIMLSSLCKGVKIGLPVFDNSQKNGSASTSETMLLTAIFLSRLDVAELRSSTIWEQERVRSPYSTRKFVLDSLHHTLEEYDALVQDSQNRDYNIINKHDLLVIEKCISNSAKRLEEKALEHFPQDLTNLHHPHPGDLASFLLLSNGLIDSDYEKKGILEHIAPLKRPLGYIRYQEDPWKYGSTEAWWTLGIPAEALYSFNQAHLYFSCHQPGNAFRSLHLGLQEMEKVSLLKQIYGYIPELLTDKDHYGKFEPNNNELAWFHGFNIQACAAGKAAIDRAEKHLCQQDS